MMQDRRTFLENLSYLSLMGLGGLALAPAARGAEAIDTAAIDISGVLDLYNPPSHCAQDHDHDDPPKFETCDWKGALEWSAKDTGFNEGALAAVRVLIKSDIPLPDEVAAAYKARGTAGAPMTGEVWKRRDMMVFAKGLAAKGQIKAAVGVAVASQWQNCWSFRCLAAQTGNVAEWLKA